VEVHYSFKSKKPKQGELYLALSVL